MQLSSVPTTACLKSNSCVGRNIFRIIFYTLKDDLDQICIVADGEIKDQSQNNSPIFFIRLEYFNLILEFLEFIFLILLFFSLLQIYSNLNYENNFGPFPLILLKSIFFYMRICLSNLLNF